MGPRVGRRALLAGAALLPLTACTSEPASPPPPDPDDTLRAAAAERERALLDRYDALLLALPTLAPRLLPLRAEHAEHLLALAGPDPTPSASTGPSPAGGGSPTTAPSGTAVPLPPAVPPPATTAEALAGLVAAEQTTAGEHARDALDAVAGELAGLLVSLAASESTHAAVLA